MRSVRSVRSDFTKKTMPIKLSSTEACRVTREMKQSHKAGGSYSSEKGSFLKVKIVGGKDYAAVFATKVKDESSSSSNGKNVGIGGKSFIIGGRFDSSEVAQEVQKNMASATVGSDYRRAENELGAKALDSLKEQNLRLIDILGHLLVEGKVEEASRVERLLDRMTEEEKEFRGKMEERKGDAIGMWKTVLDGFGYTKMITSG